MHLIICYLAQARGICVPVLSCSSQGYICMCDVLLKLGVYVSVCYLAQARGICICVLPCPS